MSHTTYRNRHNRDEHHTGTMEATLVELSAALGADLPAGTTLEEAIAIIDSRISRLENADVHVFSLKADAVVAPHRIFADAWFKAVVTGSISADAVLLATASGYITADAWVHGGAGTGFFTADAYIIVSAENATLGDMSLGDDTLGG